jgi:large subunit ribosomal protein L10
MVKDWKKQAVEDLAGEIARYKSVMVTDMTGLPAKELHHLRFNLKEKAKILVAKKLMIKKALEKLKMNELVKEVTGIPALLLSNINPFELSIVLDKEKVPSFIKAGQKAEQDIIVPAGSTNFPPGPILSELGDAGLKTKIEGGKIKIVNSTIVAKKGDVVEEKIASVLKKLEIMPAKVGININAAYEDKKVFTNIHVDIQDYMKNFERAYSEALGLAYNSGILTSETVELLLGKAHSEAFSLAIKARIYNEETLLIILAEANTHASVLMGV